VPTQVGRRNPGEGKLTMERDGALRVCIVCGQVLQETAPLATWRCEQCEAKEFEEQGRPDNDLERAQTN